MGRDCDRSASEPTARCVPSVLHDRPTEPEESDYLLWALSGGLSPPSVLGAGSVRTTTSRCACPPLPPSASLTHPQRTAPCARGCLTRICACCRSLWAIVFEPASPPSTLWRGSSSTAGPSAGRWARGLMLGRRGARTAIGQRVPCRHPTRTAVLFCACELANAHVPDCFERYRCFVRVGRAGRAMGALVRATLRVYLVILSCATPRPRRALAALAATESDHGAG